MLYSCKICCRIRISNWFLYTIFNDMISDGFRLKVEIQDQAVDTNFTVTGRSVHVKCKGYQRPSINTTDTKNVQHFFSVSAGKTQIKTIYSETYPTRSARCQTRSSIPWYNVNVEYVDVDASLAHVKWAFGIWNSNTAHTCSRSKWLIWQPIFFSLLCNTARASAYSHLPKI